jgi:hypothetical protein
LGVRGARDALDEGCGSSREGDHGGGQLLEEPIRTRLTAAVAGRSRLSAGAAMAAVGAGGVSGAAPIAARRAGLMARSFQDARGPRPRAVTTRATCGLRPPLHLR